jgi:hypothetical protein
MEDLLRRIMYRPAIAGSAIYLAEVLYRADWNIGSALLAIAVGLLAQGYRGLGCKIGLFGHRRTCCSANL